MTSREMELLAGAVREGPAEGQSARRMFFSRDGLSCLERPSYRHVERDVIDVFKMELGKKFSYKKRARKRATCNAEAFDGRLYGDYLELDSDLRARTVQMDCVKGAEGDVRAMLTLRFVGMRFQIYVLLGRKDSAHVVATLD